MLFRTSQFSLVSKSRAFLLESFTNDNKYQYCSTRYIFSAQANVAHILTSSPTEGGKVVAAAHLREVLSVLNIFSLEIGFSQSFKDSF